MFKNISQNFVKLPLTFCLISQILVHSLWHVCYVKLLYWLKFLEAKCISGELCCPVTALFKSCFKREKKEKENKVTYLSSAYENLKTYI